MLYINEGDILKLICDPLYDPRSSTPGELFYQETYDILTIGTFKKGTTKVIADFTQGQHPKLCFRIQWCPQRGQTPHADPWIHGSITLPLRFDRSTRCILVVEEEVEWNIPPEILAEPYATPENTMGAEGFAEASLPPQASVDPATAYEEEDSSVIIPAVNSITYSTGLNNNLSHSSGNEHITFDEASHRPRAQNQHVQDPGYYAQSSFELDPGADTDSELDEGAFTSRSDLLDMDWTPTS